MADVEPRRAPQLQVRSKYDTVGTGDTFKLSRCRCNFGNGLDAFQAFTRQKLAVMESHLKGGQSQ